MISSHSIPSHSGLARTSPNFASSSLTSDHHRRLEAMRAAESSSFTPHFAHACERTLGLQSSATRTMIPHRFSHHEGEERREQVLDSAYPSMARQHGTMRNRMSS